MSVVERVRSIVEPLLAERGVSLYDVELSGPNLRILVETGDLEVIEGVTRAISHALDDADPIEGHYLLEVSSPGLERPLRTAAHFAHAVGDTVTVKTTSGTEGPRRLRGPLVAADADAGTITVLDDETGAERTLRVDEVDKARTVFEWRAAPKPGKSKKHATETTNEKAVR